MILLLQDAAGQFAKVKTAGDQHPYIGFTSFALARKCLLSQGIPEQAHQLVKFGLDFPFDYGPIALFNAESELDQYLANPSNYSFERITIPALRGFAGYLPATLLQRLPKRRRSHARGVRS